jgi:outer membrane protein assembly factor BamB
VKSPRTFAAGLLVIAFALSAAACGGVKNPEGWASPVAQDSTLYYFPKKDRVTAVTLDGSLASQEWTFPGENRDDQDDLGFKAVYDATLADGILYFGSWDGRVLALDAETGEMIWTLKDGVEGGIVGGPTVSDGLVAFGTTDGHLYVRDAATGEAAPNWPDGGVGLSEGIWAAPAFGDGRLYVATMGGELYAYDLGTAQEAWTEPFANSGAIADFTLIPDGRLLVPSLNKRVYLVDAESGQQIGEAFFAKDWIWTRPAIEGDIAYFGDFSGRIYALNIGGDQLSAVWAEPYESGKRVKAAPVVLGNTLVIATRDPEVVFINRETGEALNTVPINGAGTVRAALIEHEGTAIVATTEGKLFVANPENRQVLPITIAGGGE